MGIISDAKTFKMRVLSIAREKYSIPSDCIEDHHLISDDKITETMKTDTPETFVNWFAEKYGLNQSISLGSAKILLNTLGHEL